MTSVDPPRRTTPLFSVVIPTFNRAGMVMRSIASALGQTIGDIEVIVVDDGSTDETDRLISELRDPRVSYLRHSTNLGACAARNTGIERARGEYIAFLDSDDEWLPEKLSLQTAALRQSDLGDVGIVTCGEIGKRVDGACVEWLPRRRGWIYEDLLLQRRIGCRTSNLVVRRSILQQNGIRFDPNLSARQDWDFVVNVARVAQMEIVRKPLVLVHHHGGERVWSPKRALAAGDYLHEKYIRDLEPRPRAHCRFHLRLALTCMSTGDWEGARVQINAATAANPVSPLAYGWHVGAFLSRRIPGTLVSRAFAKALRLVTF